MASGVERARLICSGKMAGTRLTTRGSHIGKSSLPDLKLASNFLVNGLKGPSKVVGMGLLLLSAAATQLTIQSNPKQSNTNRSMANNFAPSHSHVAPHVRWNNRNRSAPKEGGIGKSVVVKRDMQKASRVHSFGRDSAPLTDFSPFLR